MLDRITFNLNYWEDEIVKGSGGNGGSFCRNFRCLLSAARIEGVCMYSQIQFYYVCFRL